ncbi:hypothetical protein E2986_13928 [Frieseomelitta varia]|uniref:Glucose-methanol-choline oxidoreductase N-terminal domain-containing protein n=1 Tax=Frieseomelitta varia TaxID=561572 RepID=A0A833SEZ6_9HYME|nr:hypothetical protein E2986_13928 [Frieseomelitta varia]
MKKEVYDFIIVGAGSAGCVLLLEAGIEEPEVADIPAFASICYQEAISIGCIACNRSSILVDPE